MGSRLSVPTGWHHEAFVHLGTAMDGWPDERSPYPGVGTRRI
jgi:hypothetical protein